MVDEGGVPSGWGRTAGVVALHVGLVLEWDVSLGECRSWHRSLDACL